ncbi:MAG: methyltransferase domain-containing protein [Alphaproteobacteria bacterium]|nr:methyltransferase domain-containing protein [Alphaproteobacteria bacterium]
MLNIKQKFHNFMINHWLKVANNFYSAHNYDRAIKFYGKILYLDNKNYAANCNLATAYFLNNDYQKAQPYFEYLQKADSQNPWWQTYLSQIYQKQKSYRKALNAAWKSVKISHGAGEHQVNLAYALYEIAEIKGVDFILDMVQKFYQNYPDSGVAQQCYNTFFHPQKTAICNSEYIEKIFDIFAPEFETTLNRLHYNSPQMIAHYLAAVCHNRSNLQVLDLGCGTGMCGANIKQIMPQTILWGVDISSQMLAEADAKKIYDQLVKNDIISYLKISKFQFDVIVASDVLTYFGVLDEVIALVFSHLKKNGIFIFTISQNNLNRQSCFLTLSSRFVHRFSYVEKTLKKVGFSHIENHKKIIRKEGKKDVNGGIFVAVK